MLGMNSVSRSPISVRSLVVGLVALVGCTAPVTAQGTQDWDAVVAAAKKEGSLTVYTTTTSPSAKKIGALFEKTYGITTTVQYIRSAELRERLRTEASTGRMIADLVAAGNTFRENVPQAMAPHAPLPNAAKIKAPSKDDGKYIPTYILPFGILINTNLVSPADEPKSWTDLTDPKWKGKMLSDDPRTQGGGNGVFTVLKDKLGMDYLKKMAAQDLIFTVDTSVAARRVAQGEFPMQLAYVTGNVVQLQGLPVKALIPSEGAPYNDGLAVLTTKTDRKNAALLYLNFLLGDEAQQLFLEDGLQSVTGRTSNDLPDSIKFVATAKLLGAAEAAKVPENLKIMQEVFK